MPQTNKVVIKPRLATDAPQAAAPSTALRITGRVESLAERRERVMRTIRTRTFGILSAEDLEFVGLSRKPRAQNV